MIDLSSVTFLIPISIDNPDREENLLSVIKYLDNNLDTNIIIAENCCSPRLQYLKNIKNFKRITVPYDDVFHKTKVLNEAFKCSDTEYICSYDSDVFVPIEQFVQSLNMLKDNVCDFIITYDGTCYNVPRNHRLDLEANNFDLPINKFRKRRLNSLGGSVMFKSSVFMEGGMENENFKGWGGEDDERIHRFIKLGYRLERSHGALYHLDHIRSRDSIRIDSYYKKNLEELKKVSNMTKEKLSEYVRTWQWTKTK